MSEPNLNSLYQQLILDHYRNPRNKGELPESAVPEIVRPFLGHDSAPSALRGNLPCRSG